MIIAEQIPGRLIGDALKNTNLKIVHRLPGEDDRKAIGGTMNLGAEQEPYLAKLAPGQAAFFTEGFEKPTFIIIPNLRAEYRLPERVAEERVAQAMEPSRAARFALDLPLDGCIQCVRQCEYRDRVTGVVYELGAAKKFALALQVSAQQRQSDESAAWMELAKACREILQRVTLKNDEHATFCCFVHLWGKPVSAESSNQFRQAFRRIAAGG
ncbi:MAG: hypothetical protein AB1817_03695 [Chloroflexota bacterium]